MRIVSAARTPAKKSPGAKLERKRPNEFGYVNEPIEGRRGKPHGRNIPDVVRKHLRGVDLTSIRPSELKRIGGELHREGYLSHAAAEQFALVAFDLKDRPQNMVQELEQHLKAIRKANHPMYAVGLMMDEAAVDAVHGMQAIAMMLRGQSIDTYA